MMRSEEILESMTDAFVALDCQWRITYVNSVAARLNHLNPEAMLGQSHWELWAWAKGTIVEENYQRAMAQQTPVHFEVLYEPLNMWLEIHAYPSPDSLEIFFRDISDRKFMEQQLHHREELNRRIQESSADCIKILDLEGRLLSMNKAGQILLGITDIQPFLNRVWSDLWLPDYRERTENAVLRARKGETTRFQGYFPTQKGEPRWWDVLVTPIMNEQGNVENILALSRDITQNKQIEQEREQLLHELEAERFRLEAVLQQMPAGVIIAEAPSGKLILGNDKVSEIWGHDFIASDEVNEYEEYKGFHLDGRPYEVTEWPLARSILYGEVVTNEKMIFLRKDGRRIFAEVNSTPIRNTSGEIVAGVVIFNDISEQHTALRELEQAEAALRQSEARTQARVEELEILMETVPAAIWIAHDAGCHTMSANQAAYQLMRIPSGSIATSTPAEGDYPFTFKQQRQGKDIPMDELPMQLATVTGKEIEGELEFVFDDGTVSYLYGKAVPLYNEQGNVRGAIGAFLDITERKEVEKALQKSNERLSVLSGLSNQLLLQGEPKKLIQNLFEALANHLDLDLYFNYLLDDEQQKLFLHSYSGISPQTAAEIYWLELGHAVCGTVALHRKSMIIETVQESTDSITQLIRSEGVQAYAGYPLIAQGQFIGTLSFGTRNRTRFEEDELTLMQTVCDRVAVALERSRLLEQLQQRAEELTQANQIKDEFLAVLSHELRTPLNPILGWASLLQRRKFEDKSLNQALEIIIRNVKLQVQLIDDLLDVSRILRGKLNLKMGSVDLSITIMAAIETVRLAAHAKSIAIETHIQPNVSKVLGDAGRLQQVVWNLLSNAVKFTPSHGRVEIILKQIGTEVQIQVSDTGRGIRPDFLPHVFDYFRQEDGATTRKFGGLGLGLAIVKYITEMHGGTVIADSAGEDLGSTFTVCFPVISPSNSPESEDLHLASFDFKNQLLEGINILVVEDDKDTRDFLSFLLQEAGASLSVVNSAQKALATLEESPPDVIVSDIGMPEMDGYMLMKQVQATFDKPVGAIALTAYAGEGDIQQAKDAGFQIHLPKPIEPDRLIQAILDLTHH